MKPNKKPSNPNFSSGPCTKRPGWSTNILKNALIGRSHRSKECKDRILELISLIRKILTIPDEYMIGIIPASDTGAVESALWSLLGPKNIDILAWDSFGKDWVTDVTNQLKIKNTRVLTAGFGHLPDLSSVDFTKDIIFTWNGTTTGTWVPDGEWISDERLGLTICDATSAVFAVKLPWEKLDVTTFSWQKVLGGEAQHGIIIIGPRAIQRLEEHTPIWPIPKIFRLASNKTFNQSIFEGNTINTPSMLCIEDTLDALKWIERIGGLDETINRSRKNLEEINKSIHKNQGLKFLSEIASTRSTTSICLAINSKWFLDLSQEQKVIAHKKMINLLEENNVAYDITSYRDVTLGFRIWGGSTVETSDISRLMPWIYWSMQKVSEKY